MYLSGKKHNAFNKFIKLRKKQVFILRFVIIRAVFPLAFTLPVLFCFFYPRFLARPDDSVGFWHVGKHPSPDKQDDWSRVYYSVQVRIPSWVPGIVIGYLNKKAITEVR